MAVVVVDSGSQTATVSTTHTLNTGTPPRTSDVVAQLRVDVNAMVAGDHLILYASEKVQDASGTARDFKIGELYGVQTSKAWVSPPLLLANGWDFKLRQEAGTSRAFPWSIWQT